MPARFFSLAWGEVTAAGVDFATGVSDEVRDAARALAQEQGCVVAVTGFVDFVTDGDRELRVHNGHPLMARVTGTGCMLGAVLGACLAVGIPPFEAAVSALVLFGVAGSGPAPAMSGRGRSRSACSTRSPHWDLPTSPATPGSHPDPEFMPAPKFYTDPDFKLTQDFTLPDMKDAKSA